MGAVQQTYMQRVHSTYMAQVTRYIQVHVPITHIRPQRDCNSGCSCGSRHWKQSQAPGADDAGDGDADRDDVPAEGIKTQELETRCRAAGPGPTRDHL